MKKVTAFLLCILMCLITIPIPNANAASSFKVQAYNQNKDTTNNTITLFINLVNNGTTNLTLSTIKMRYYFTNDGTQDNNFACDYSSAGSANVTGSFGTVNANNADRFLEIGFNSNAGTLAAGNSIMTNVRIWKTDWSTFTQTNDYSFDASSTSYADQETVTAYIDNTLIWGVEPDTTNVPPTPTISPLIPELEIAEYDVPDNAATQLVEDMKLGWNLGNTFDAYNCDWITDELEYEAAWCGVYTTKELMDTLKETGFKTIRIPVSWRNHVDGDSFEISEVWMNRVQEVVNYCIDNDMYVIINIHHDVDTAYYYPSTEYLENSKRYVSYIWTQIAERFADYDEHLIFEGINEPRLVGHTNEWWIDLNNAEVVDSLRCINELNQVFVDTVRATGGKNASRYLMCPGYCASTDGATNTYFKLPTDTSGNNKLIVSVHAYTPYSFALDRTGTSYWSVNDQSSVNSVNEFLDILYNKYTSQGIPVVIGEFGALDKNGNLQSRVEYASYYIAAARARGISCLWWDNHAFTGEGELFGLINRSTYEFEYPEIVQGMIIYAGGDETGD